MPKFEVHIPANDQKSFSFTFRVDADGWTAALKAGMARLGQHGGNQGQNMLVDVQDDNSLHVTDAESGRVFQIRELSEQEADTAVLKKRVTGPLPPPAPVVTPIPVPGPGFSPGAETIIESRGAIPEHIRQELDAYEARISAPRSGRVEDEEEEKTDPSLHAARTVQEMGQIDTPAVTPQEVIPTRVVTPKVSQKVTAPPPTSPEVTRVSRRGGTPKGIAPYSPSGSRNITAPEMAHEAPREPTTRRGAAPKSSGDLPVVELERPIRPITGTIGRTRSGQHEVIESMLAEVFERVQEVYSMVDPTEALYFLLDLAMEKIPSDAGSVLEVDAQGDLRFSAARGPKAAELLEAALVVPFGSGIAGFCAHEGVTVALSDVQKDPRYYPEIARRLDYHAKSVLASPMMTHGRTFGCIQLLNKKDSPLYAAHEVGILSYIAHQAALYLGTLT
ncbi:MAG TPA: GAF domain-containing protein [Myxococcales bacterium]|nr:GAF domain-containing protein [Myxococcales bacterium]